MSLRTKWVLALVCLTALASGAVGLLSYRVAATQLDSEVDRSLRTAVAEAVSDSQRLPGPRRRPPPLSGAGDIDLQYLRADGTAVARAGATPLPVQESDLALAAQPQRDGEAFRDDEIGDEAIRVLTASLGDGRGAVQAARSIEETTRVLASLRTRILVVTIGVAAVAGFAGMLIGGSVTRRLLRLSGVAEHVADTGALEASVPAEGSDEVARLGRAFNDMLDALARSEAEQTRLVADAGHELRTPMTSLRTNIFTLRGFAELDDETRAEVISDLESETEELSGLIEEVLAASAGASTQEAPATVDVGTLVGSVARRTAGHWERPVLIEVPEPVTATLREGQVSRALRNLVDNACKFSPPGSPIEVVVRAADADGGAPGVEIAVLDRGPGFDEGELEAVFARFHRSVAARSQPGSGLGLSIVATVAEAHGGRVQAANREGGGARVAMWIPLPGGDGAISTNRR